jgi:hypothetical protein
MIFCQVLLKMKRKQSKEKGKEEKKGEDGNHRG